MKKFFDSIIKFVFAFMALLGFLEVVKELATYIARYFGDDELSDFSIGIALIFCVLIVGYVMQQINNAFEKRENEVKGQKIYIEYLENKIKNLEKSPENQSFKKS